MIKIAIVVACCGLCSSVPAVTPAPDGGYPNNNTAEGENALFSLTTGNNNTAIGFNALYSNTTGTWNTASGYQALVSNITGYFNTAIGASALQSNTSGYWWTRCGGRQQYELNRAAQQVVAASPAPQPQHQPD